MNEYEIDTVAAAGAVRGWVAIHDATTRRRRRVADACAPLHVHDGAATGLFDGAIERLEEAMALTTRVARAAETADDLRSIIQAMFLGAPGGDLGGTYTAERRADYAFFASTSVGRSRALLARALTDVGHSRRLAADEFGIVRVADDRAVVVLPGVVDLSEPNRGWDPRHRSVRDLDQSAWPSFGQVGVDSNPYAEMVVEALDRLGLPPGSELMIVGHSYGAETAIDLAADPAVNGDGAYRVTHVVAAGYEVEPMLSSVPPETEVLVLRNQRDVVATAEEVGGIVPIDHLGDAADRIGDSDWRGALGDLADVAQDVAAGVTDSVSDRSGGLAEVGGEMADGDVAGVLDDVDDLVGPDVGVRTTGSGAVVNVFDGGWSDIGHGEQHYVDAVESVSDPRIDEYLESVDAAGYTAGGTLLAVDVSVPGGARANVNRRER